LHGNETPARAAEIARHFGIPVIKAIAVGTPDDTIRAFDYLPISPFVLFDAKPPKTDNALPGGNGLVFDWDMIASVRDRVPFMLSGGLTADNVADAIRQTGAKLVDVSSGVESAPGVKDPELIRRFLHAVKTAKQA
jgi:phosphoribosylanthranilate isomerase